MGMATHELRVRIPRFRVREDHATFVRMQSLKESMKELTKTMRIFPKVCVFLGVLCGMAVLMTGPVSKAQDRSQARSMVISRNGIVAAEAPLAAQAGGRVLER